MKKLLLIAAFALALPTAAGAQSTYDWQSGNQYHSNQNFDGSTTIRGFNYNTGSSWNTTVEPDGDMRGTDSQGNMWQYDDSTGFYQNYGTGTTCTGKGAFRTCY